jgi:hypothetical protein
MWGGSVSAAKFEGFNIVSAGKTIDDFCGAGSVRDGMPAMLIGSGLVAEDVLTGQLDNGSTAEITMGIAAIAYGNPVIYSPLPIAAGGSAIQLASTTDTVGSLPGAWVTAATTWTGLTPTREYSIIGAGGWGTLDVALRFASITEEEQTFKPGVPLGTTAAMGCMTYLAEPYKFKGSSPPALEISSLGASAEHHLTILVV